MGISIVSSRIDAGSGRGRALDDLPTGIFNHGMVKHHFLTRLGGHDATPQALERVFSRTFGFLDCEEDRLLLGAKHIKISFDNDFNRCVVDSYSGSRNNHFHTRFDGKAFAFRDDEMTVERNQLACFPRSRHFHLGFGDFSR